MYLLTLDRGYETKLPPSIIPRLHFSRSFEKKHTELFVFDLPSLNAVRELLINYKETLLELQPVKMQNEFAEDNLESKNIANSTQGYGNCIFSWVLTSYIPAEMPKECYFLRQKLYYYQLCNVVVDDWKFFNSE